LGSVEARNSCSSLPLEEPCLGRPKAIFLNPASLPPPYPPHQCTTFRHQLFTKPLFPPGFPPYEPPPPFLRLALYPLIPSALPAPHFLQHRTTPLPPLTYFLRPYTNNGLRPPRLLEGRASSKIHPIPLPGALLPLLYDPLLDRQPQFTQRKLSYPPDLQTTPRPKIPPPILSTILSPK